MFLLCSVFVQVGWRFAFPSVNMNPKCIFFLIKHSVDKTVVLLVGHYRSMPLVCPLCNAWMERKNKIFLSDFRHWMDFLSFFRHNIKLRSWCSALELKPESDAPKLSSWLLFSHFMGSRLLLMNLKICTAHQVSRRKWKIGQKGERKSVFFTMRIYT